MSISNCSELTKQFINKFGNRVSFDEPLAPYVFYKVGGPADILVFPRSESELVWIAERAKNHDLAITLIGKGTNILVQDGGIPGITLSLQHKEDDIVVLEESREQDTVMVQAGAGVEKAQLLEWAIAQGYQGLEFSAGVPGSVGGGIFMNAGTKYGCYGDVLKEIRLFDFSLGPRTINRNQIQFAYRGQSLLKEGRLVVSVVLELSFGDPPVLRQRVDSILAERADKQPLDLPSCGSTFKNPHGQSAGRLIEKAGLKGFTVGDAIVSPKHANFILNRGNATASDILTLIHTIKDRVKEKFAVELKCEVIVLGQPHVSDQLPI